MKDGTYEINVELSGGSGRASVKSPAELTVGEDEMTARIEWSSPNYDLMIVRGEGFLPVNKEGNSVFQIPVADLDAPLDVQAETVAMSEPHLIDYTLVFDPDSVKAAGKSPLPWIAATVLLAAVTAAVFALVRKKKSRS